MPYIDGILIPYAPPGQQACTAILAALDARDLPRPAVTSSVVADLGHGFVDCPYWVARPVRITLRVQAQRKETRP